jgi:hypothetical protein
MNIDDSDAEDEDPANRPQYLKLDLLSTVSFKEIDIDTMLKHTTLDDFLRGLYINTVNTNFKPSK